MSAFPCLRTSAAAAAGERAVMAACQGANSGAAAANEKHGSEEVFQHIGNGISELRSSSDLWIDDLEKEKRYGI